MVDSLLNRTYDLSDQSKKKLIEYVGRIITNTNIPFQLGISMNQLMGDMCLNSYEIENQNGCWRGCDNK